MDEIRLEQLISKYKDGKLSSLEAEELNKWFHSLDMDRSGFEKWLSEVGGEPQMALDMFQDFNHRFMTNQKVVRLRQIKWSVAGAAIVLISAANYFFVQKKTSGQQAVQLQQQHIVPGSNQAILTLANGQKVILTGAQKGLIATQGQIVIKKSKSGQIVYDEGSIKENLLANNTITTPRGGQYQVILADGTKVFLNAASSLTYPVSFNGPKRVVKLTGEAYFEVVHNDKMPFEVETRDETVKDIGTHFNINAYSDEPTEQTTLLEGAVNIQADNHFQVIKPGQQTILSNGKLSVKDANLEEVVAWKNGYFRFNQESIQSIMRKLSRWYNIDVEFEGTVTDEEFSGTLERSRNISEILEILEYSKSVHFKIDGRRVTVLR